ncbi:hypothetical protein [Roseibium sp.]|uniref:hypothetical protein n=1 Tax=Roseibium sp. TaxID=1936156 RepID=UPI003264763F
MGGIRLDTTQSIQLIHTQHQEYDPDTQPQAWLQPVPGHVTNRLAREDARPSYTTFVEVLGVSNEKGEAIENRLTYQTRENLRMRCAQMIPVEKKLFDEILTFKHYARARTTEEMRMDIRTILTAVVAQGCPLDLATVLRKDLKHMTAEEVADLVRRLSYDDCALFELEFDPERPISLEVLKTGLKTSLGELLFHLRLDLDEELLNLFDSLVYQHNNEPQQDIARGLFMLQLGDIQGAAELLGQAITNLTFMYRNPEGLELMNLLLARAPVEPDRANQREATVILQKILDVRIRGFTVARDETGQLQLERVSNVKLHIDQKLTQEQVDNIRTVFEEVCDKPYSRLGGILEFARYVRDQRQENPDAMLADLFAAFEPDLSTVVDEYGFGNCISLAAKLQSRLADIGIQSIVTGIANPGLTGLSLTQDQSGLVHHTDVVIPYIGEDNEQHHVMIVPGMGVQPAPGVYGQEFFGDHTEPFQGLFYLTTPEGEGVQIGTVQKDAMGHLAKIQSRKEAPDGTTTTVFGVDLNNGTIYLNGKASEEYAGAEIGERTDRGRVVLNFRELLSNPDGTTTVMVPTENAGTEPMEMTNREACELFLTCLGHQFFEGQPDPEATTDLFVDDMMAFLEIAEEYGDTVLWPAVRETKSWLAGHGATG